MSELKPERFKSYELYVVLDMFSRFVVGWRVERTECDELAKRMFHAAFIAQGVHPRVVHADGGPSMQSKTVQMLFHDLGITASKNRPRVSNDNPYSESWFKTSKYHPWYPQVFHTLEEARDWAGLFVRWYNEEHRHSGIGWHTPASVFDGSYQLIAVQRQEALDAHYLAHPNRYGGVPQVPALPIEVWINNPERRLQID